MADDGTNGNMDTSGSQQNDDDRKLFAGGLAQEVCINFLTAKVSIYDYVPICCEKVVLTATV